MLMYGLIDRARQAGAEVHWSKETTRNPDRVKHSPVRNYFTDNMCF